MQFRNESQQKTTFELGAELHVIGPGQTVDIPEGYARPRRSAGGDRIPPAIERLAPQLKPADAAARAAWEQAPSEEDVAAPLAPVPTKAQLLAKGVPEGVAEQIVARETQARPRGKSKDE